MSVPRLASAVLVRALIRLAEAQNGFGVVLAKGDDTAGAVIVQLLEKGQFSGLYERVLASDERYEWRACGPQPYENIEQISAYMERRRAGDADLWLVELDIPDAQRFIVESLAAA